MNPELQLMGKSSGTSPFNLPGRLAWTVAELISPINLIYILYSLPSKLPPLSSPITASTSFFNIGPNTTSLFGTGLPITHEIMGLLFVIHYANRAFITPVFVAPSMSPIHPSIMLSIAVFQFCNSTSIAGWLCYNAQARAVDSSVNNTPPVLSLSSLLGMSLFIGGLAGNISAEWHLFELRRGAAKRKARSEGKAKITYDKVYVVPEAKGWYKYVLYPHYSLEWIEWIGYWVLGGAWGLGWGWPASAAALFVVNEITTMTPRAVDGVRWYEGKFGKKAVAGRKAVVPGII